MAEPSRNSYVITVVLHDVRKPTALEIAETILEDVQQEFAGKVGEVMVVTGHVKDFADRTVTVPSE